MLRISPAESTPQGVALHLEGQITGPWTDELSAACERVLAAGRRLTLDLGDVSLIDRPALTLLAALSRRGVTFTRCSPFHEEQLRQATAPRAEASHHAP
jgi:hypothetical protein